MAGIPASRSSSKFLPLSLLARQSLLSPLADEVSFNLRRQAEGKCKHLALDIIPEAVTIFYGPDTTLPDHADIQYLHDHEQIPSQTREFGTDYQITLTHALKQPPELPFGVALRAADSLFYPAVDLYALTTAEIGDFKSLILYGLLVTADAYVAVVQNKSFSRGEILRSSLVPSMPRGTFLPKKTIFVIVFINCGRLRIIYSKFNKFCHPRNR